MQDIQNNMGFVALVGAGPGAEDLLTLRALNRIQRADVIVYDRLVSKEVLDFAKDDAELVYVGKEPGKPCVKQEQINEILISEAMKGRFVVRLKCGDPMIFGRLGEEVEALQGERVSYEIVPGVTAATACAADAGVALTQREEVRSVVFLTGHSTTGATPYDWSAMARPGTVFVLYMAVKMTPKIQTNLMAVGVPGNTPVTITEKGASKDVRVFDTSLKNLATKIKSQKITNPAIIFIHYGMSIDKTNIAHLTEHYGELAAEVGPLNNKIMQRLNI